MSIRSTLAHLFHPRRSNNHRSRLLHAESFLLLGAVAFGFGLFVLVSPRLNSQLGNVLGYASNISAQAVIDQTNARRQAEGLNLLTHNAALSQAAQAKAGDMFALQYWAHTSPQGREPWSFISGAGYSYISAGENLARDFMQTEDMMAAWMASQTHRENIMSAKYDEIGVAVVNGVLDGVETTLVVQMFGKPRTTQTAAVTQVAAQDSNASQAQSTPLPTPSPTPVPTQVPTPTPAIVNLGDTSGDESMTAVENDAIISAHSMISPLQLVKAFGVSLVFLIGSTLVYDEFIAHKHRVIRLVGKNLAHLLFLLTVALVMVVFKGGFIG